MVEQYGNSIPVPGGREWSTGVNTEILFSTVGFTQKGVTLEAGQGVLQGGTLLVQDTATLEYKAWSGSGPAAGILRKTTDTGASDDAPKFHGNIVVAGIVQLPKILKANGISTGASLVTALPGSRVDSTIGYFKF